MIVCSWLGLLGPGSPARAAEIRVLSVGSVQVPIRSLANQFNKDTGHSVALQVVTPSDIPKHLAAARYDMIICSIPAMDTLVKANAIVAGTRSQLARVGIGVMVRSNAPPLDVTTPETFKHALLDAISIVHGDPFVPNQSGVVTMRILTKLGILDAIRMKMRPAPLGEGLQMVANGDVELALFNSVELPAGVRLAGLVPAELADYTFYETAVLAKGSVANEATAFIRYVTSPDAAKAWNAAGIEGYPYR